MRRFFTCFIIMIGTVLLASCAAQKRSSAEIIEELAVSYGNYGDEAEEKNEELLNELKGVDADLYDKWDRIMELWKTDGKEPEVHEKILPDGLSKTDSLCMIALGFQLSPKGDIQEELIRRLEVVKACAEKYPNAWILCTGGPTATENPEATEADKMKEWLVKNGVDEKRIIVENKSKTTAQNAMYSYEILQSQYPQVTDLAIISSDYHIATGTLLFGAECILQGEKSGEEKLSIVSNAAYKAPKGTLSTMFQAGALIELSGNKEAAFEIYYGNYDIHPLQDLS